MAEVFSSGFSTPAFIDALADVYNGVNSSYSITHAYILIILYSSSSGQCLLHSACQFGVS